MNSSRRNRAVDQAGYGWIATSASDGSMLFALQILTLVLAALVAAVTLLPLSPSRRWWVRIWDFPRLHIAGTCALLLPLAFLLERPLSWIIALGAAAALAWQLSWIWPFTPFARSEVRLAPDAEGGVTLLAVNVLQENAEHDRVLRLIEQVDPDVLLLMETDSRWIEALQPALAAYPTVVLDPRDDFYGMTFATRLETIDAKVMRLTHDETPTLFAELKARNGQEFVYVGLHPQPPTPDGADTDERDAQIAYSARFARKEDRPLVAMGDFNEAAWSLSAREFQRVGGYVDPRRGRGFFSSFHAEHPLIRAPIDQIYVTADVAVVGISLGPKVGSDHLPLIARLRFEPDLAARLNRPPKPLDPGEITRIDEVIEAYRSRLATARMEAESARADASA
jgi:endonuclease/exonuclease/phosphatase (EEP) superfamily protein YafD